MPSFFTRVFGPSTADRLIDVLREDRAAQAALLTELVASIREATALQRAQIDALRPSGLPEVRVMTDLDEVARDKARRASAPDASAHFRTIDPHTLLAELSTTFASEAQHG